MPSTEKGEEPSYWRDLGTIEAYYEANMDLFRLILRSIYTRGLAAPHHGLWRSAGQVCLRLVRSKGTALDSIVSQGIIISGSVVKNLVWPQRENS